MTTSSGHSPQAPTRLALVLVVQCLVVLACVAVTTAVAAAVQERTLRTATAERVLDVSQSLAELEQVRTAVQTERVAAMADLQPLADLIEQAAGVDYVVITDANGIRLTHPTPSERGRPVSTDATDVLAGETFVGTEVGTLGATLRAKVPVVVDGDVVGAASVGILESEIAGAVESAVAGLVPWVLGAVVVGCSISAVVIWFLRRRVRRLEDRAREFETQRRIADALRDQTHEFRTRIHVVRGLVAEGAADEALAYVDRIAPVTTAADAAIDVPDAALRALLRSLADDAAARGATFEVDPLTTVTTGALVDEDMVVIANLCRNAVEATGEGGRVRVLVVADGSTVHVDVGDDGPGVAPGSAAGLFERGASSKGAAGERGVGLDIVRREVSARGGTIEVGQSEWGGARFTVDAPSKGRVVS
ncbi:ATP-binding protein [Microbacterium sp. Marseille-Q6648]|uniref:sensor histidine kinase n=1 Tax=Microbacterium sp. Marseille-Q6648 TaxID=2937991 RepID=UPI00203A494D|nr:ATP-binding protein [Microbacterium sp. Marseille-Q6648]